MPLFSKEQFDNFISILKECFSFIADLLDGFFVVLRTHSILFVPLLLAVLLVSAFVVGFIILSVSDKAYGIKFQNPNKYYLTSFPAINHIWSMSKKFIKTNINERNKIAELNRKMATDEESLKYANRFFEHNPWAYRITLNGRTYFRPGWSEVNWRKGKAEYIKKEVSFDIDKAVQKSKVNRADFGDPKYKRKH